MIKLSVFGVVAVIAYIIGVARNASKMAQPYQDGLKVVMQSGSDTMPLQYLFVIVLIMHVLLAARLYIHAWIVDEHDAFRQAIRKQSTTVRIGEWLLRLAWVAGMAWLPDYYGRAAAGKSILPGISEHSYLVIIAAFVLVWDHLVKGTIFGYTLKDKSDLQKNWLRLDVLLVLILATPWLVQNRFTSGAIGNWTAIFLPVSFIGGCIVSGYQLVLWGPYVFKADGSIQAGESAV